MSKPFDPAALPDDIARAAVAQVRAGRFATVEDVLRAGLEAVADDQREGARADATAWQNYQARRPADPRDLSAAEANACLNSDDPTQHQVLKAHLDALRDDLRAGKGLKIESTAELMAGIRARLGVPSV